MKEGGFEKVTRASRPQLFEDYERFSTADDENGETNFLEIKDIN